MSATEFNNSYQEQAQNLQAFQQLLTELGESISKGAPKNTFEVLMVMYIYFMCSESIDSYQVRSMGNGFDRALYPYYKNDIENGTFTREKIKSFIAYFFLQFSARILFNTFFVFNGS